MKEIRGRVSKEDEYRDEVKKGGHHMKEKHEVEINRKEV
jgi:hypothetical protein